MRVGIAQVEKDLLKADGSLMMLIFPVCTSYQDAVDIECSGEGKVKVRPSAR